MFVHYRTKGFVLKKVDRGEADQLFTIFTKDEGKLEVLGRAIKKMKSKLRAGIPLFSISEIEFIQGKAYKTLTDAAIIKDFKDIKKNLIKLKTAFKIAETFDQLIKAPERDDKTWQLLEEVFNHLNNYSLPTTRYPLVYYYFLWNLLSVLGYRPELYKCLACRKKLKPEKLYFSQKGGLVCSLCYKKETCLPGSSPKRRKQEALEINVNVVKILREVLKEDLNRLLKMKIKREYQDSLKEMSDFYYSRLKVY